MLSSKDRKKFDKKIVGASGGNDTFIFGDNWGKDIVEQNEKILEDKNNAMPA